MMRRMGWGGVWALTLMFGIGVVRAAGPESWNDAELWRKFADDLGGQHNSGGTPSLNELREQLRERTKTRVELLRVPRLDLKPEAIYRKACDSVVAIGSVFKCNRCPHWHTGGTATGWVVGRRGEVVSNHHVFAEERNTNVVAIGVMTSDGRCFPVREVLAADRERDVAIFRIDAVDLPRLPLAPAEPVGRPISVIAHPNGELFTFTQGHVSRYAQRSVRVGADPVEWMYVTADFAVGSSGGPVLNRKGAVVGMVARTRTIVADAGTDSAASQMVVKMTVPSEAILRLVEGVR